MDQTIGGETPSQGAQPCFRLIQMVQHANRVDVVERAFVVQVQQAALFLTQRAHLGGSSGALQTLASHRQGPFADVDPEDVGTWVEMAEVVGAHPGAATGIQDAGPLRARRHHPMDGSEDAQVAPTPVVSRWWTVLQRITREGKTVVEGAHHRSGGIPEPGVSHAGEIGSCRAFHNFCS